MVKHIKYNYRTDKDGNVFYEYFTVGEEANYAINVTDFITFKVDAIDVYDDHHAVVAAFSGKESYSITVSGVYSVLTYIESV